MKKVYALLFVVSIALKTHAQWVEKNNGLTGRTINALTTSGTNLFAGTDNGVYLSPDNAASWTDVTDGIGSDWGPPVPISSLAANGSNLYAGSDGVYLSTNAGVSWTHLSPVWGTFVQSVAVKGSNLFACGRAVFRSTDNGNSWTDFPTLVDDYSIVRLIGSGSNIYAVTNRPAVYLLGNGDTNWIAANIGLAKLPLSGTLFSLTESASNLFAATSAGVFLSTDNGTNWITIRLPTTDVRSLAVSANNLFVGGAGGIWSRPLSDLNPTITTFAPLSGTMGSEVIIEGSGFDITPVYVVKFNGVNASVVASTSTSITAVVPFDAGSGPISVTADYGYGQSVTSTQAFTIIKLPQTIDFKQLPDIPRPDFRHPIGFTASASSHMKLDFITDGTKLSVNHVYDNFYFIYPFNAGRASITATQAGNNSFFAATPVTQSICINPPQPSISLSNTNAGTVILISSADTGNQWYQEGVPIAGATNDSLQVPTTGVYQVRVQVDDCVSLFSREEPIIVTGDISTPRERVVVSPNPVETYLELKGIVGEIQKAQLFDMTGGAQTILLERESDVYKANVQYLSQGFYLLRVEDKISVRVIKFVKK